MSRIDETIDFIPVRIAVLTVSDTRGLDQDRSGDTLVDRIAAAGHTLAARDIVTDDRDRIADRLREWVADPDIDVVISTGAAPGLLCLPAARLIGARTLWIDSIANGERLSLSGRIARRLAHECLTQWEHLACEPKPKYRGAVL